ncbi:MAG TPA: 5'-3' exonuclease H3TH domain-containing protein, partial [Gammaproteobacteria bacterium]|nr:5'-3' exonuclease H3TH domain-containing protein [Gammaproteobacteria bacterium]
HFEGALESTISSTRRALKELAPTHAACVFDAGGRSWRHELFPDYKRDRPPMPELLRLNLHRVEEAIANLGVRCLSVPGFEADDVIATIAVKTAARDGQVVILSTDKSMCQLAGERIRIRDHFAERDLDRAYISKKYDVTPSQLTCLLGLMGDKSLNIPGVRSVGARTAAKLIHEYGTLEEILASAKEIPGRLGRVLSAEAAQARLSVALVRLKTDVNVGINLKDLRLSSGRHRMDKGDSPNGFTSR